MTNKISFRKFKDYHIEQLQNSNEECKQYLKIALEEYLQDNDKEAFYQALKDIVDARGGTTAFSKATAVSRQNLYKIFSGKTNPRLETIGLILKNLGLTLTVELLH